MGMANDSVVGAIPSDLLRVAARSRDSAVRSLFQYHMRGCAPYGIITKPAIGQVEWMYARNPANDTWAFPNLGTVRVELTTGKGQPLLRAFVAGHHDIRVEVI